MNSLTVWMTGLSGAGKTTLSNRICREMERSTENVFILDNDSLRKGLCSDLGYLMDDRSENIRRAANVASILCDAGVIVIAAMISPLAQHRAMARSIIGPARFVETYLCASLERCEKRDPKGLYRAARAGVIPNFTGVTSPYEPPENPDILLDTGILSEDEAVSSFFDQFNAVIRMRS